MNVLGRPTWLPAAALLLSLAPVLIPELALARAGDSADTSRVEIPTAIFAGPIDLADNADLHNEHPHALMGFASAFPVGLGLTAGIELLTYSANYDAPSLAPPFAGTYSSSMHLEVLGVGANLGWAHTTRRVRAFGSAGVGAYSSVLTVDNLQYSSFGANEHYAHAGVDIAAGVDVRMPRRWFVQLAARKLWLPAEFHMLAGGKVALDVGSVTVGVGREFHAPAWFSG